MLKNKRGQGLPLTTVVIAILVVVVLVVIVAFFLGGTSGLTKTIKSVFFGTTAGTDKALAIQNCNQYCDQAKSLPQGQIISSPYCTKHFFIDEDLDGEADTVNNLGKDYIKFYCQDQLADANKQRSLQVSCPGLVEPCSQPRE